MFLFFSSGSRSPPAAEGDVVLNTMRLTDDPEYKRWRQAVVQTVRQLHLEGQSTLVSFSDHDLEEGDATTEAPQSTKGKDDKMALFDPTDFEYTDDQGTVRRSLEDDKMAPKESTWTTQAPQAPQSTKGKDDKKMLTDADLEAMIE